MQDKLNQAVNDAEASGDDPTILRSDTVAVQRLENEYRLTLNDYTQNDLLGDSPHDVQLLNSAHTHLPIQAQRSLAQNALGSWQTYQSAINTVLGDLQSGDLIGARVALAGAVERAHRFIRDSALATGFQSNARRSGGQRQRRARQVGPDADPGRGAADLRAGRCHRRRKRGGAAGGRIRGVGVVPIPSTPLRAEAGS